LAKFKFILWLVEFLNTQSILSFEWDDGNSTKSLDKHGVENSIVESAFYDQMVLALGEQYQPIVNESRYGIIAKSSAGSILFICFTIRNGKIRCISSRPANKNERSLYDKEL
jgi:hypothetical protein